MLRIWEAFVDLWAEKPVECIVAVATIVGTVVAVLAFIADRKKKAKSADALTNRDGVVVGAGATLTNSPVNTGTQTNVSGQAAVTTIERQENHYHASDNENYKKLESRILGLEQKLASSAQEAEDPTLPKQEREKLNKQIEQLNAQLRQKEEEKTELEERIRNLAADIEKEPLESERGKLAQAAWQKGKASEASGILRLADMQGDRVKLLTKKGKLQAAQEKTDEHLENLAEEFILKAKITLTDMENPNRFDEAIALFEEAVTTSRATGVLLAYAIHLYKQNQFKSAEPLYTEALDAYRKLASANPQAYLPYVAMTLNNLAILHWDTNDYAKAETEYSEALEAYRKLASANPQAYLPDVAATLNNLAGLHWKKTITKKRNLQSPRHWMPTAS